MELKTVYIPIKEHSIFKILESGISLENCYPDELITFTQEEYNKHIEEIIKDVLEIASEKAAIRVINDHYVGEVIKKSITNTLKQSYNKWKI